MPGVTTVVLRVDTRVKRKNEEISERMFGCRFYKKKVFEYLI